VTDIPLLPPRQIGPITRTDIVRYQGASGDMNPIHHDEPFAVAAGYPAPLCVGMFQAGALVAWAADWLGPDKLRRCRVRWKEPVFPGDVLTFHAAVHRREGESLELHLTCMRRGPDQREAGLAVEAWATFQI
jgi:acyl dehydratase